MAAEPLGVAERCRAAHHLGHPGAGRRRTRTPDRRRTGRPRPRPGSASRSPCEPARTAALNAERSAGWVVSMPAAMTSTAVVPDSTAPSMSALRSRRYCWRANEPMLWPSSTSGMPGCSSRAIAVSADMSSTSAGPPGRAEVAVAVRIAGRAAVATVVVGVHDVAGVDERLGEPGVAGGVLAHPVGDLDDRRRVAVARPAVDEDLLAVRAGDREGRRVHGPPTLPSGRAHERGRRGVGRVWDDDRTGDQGSDGPQPPRRRARRCCRPPARRRPPARPGPRRRRARGAHDVLPDVVHIAGWLDAERQRRARRATFRRWAVPPAGLRHPRVPSGHLMSVQSVCLGWHWQPYALHAHGRRHRRGAGEAAARRTSSTLARVGRRRHVRRRRAPRRTRPTRRSSTSTHPVPASGCTRTARSRRRRPS